MRLNISHNTVYRYDGPVAYGLQQVRLTPKARAGQEIVNWSITVEGGTKQLSFDDEHNNHVDLVSIDPDASELRIMCQGEVDTPNNAGVVGTHGGFAPLWLFRRQTSLTRPGEGVKRLLGELDMEGTDEIARMHALSKLISDQVVYQTGTTDVATSAEDAIAAGHGVCQDHAQIFLSATRELGHPARYVSGYLMMSDRTEQDATHAWAEVHLDGIGWVGFDVSNGYSPDERYARVATGLDYRGAAPVSGMRYGDSHEELSVNLTVSASGQSQRQQ